MLDLNATATHHLNDTHYLKSVTELGDRQPLFTSEHIHSTTGLRLVNRGSRFDSRLYQRLLCHKLTPPLDQCLTIENPFNTHQLAEAAAALLQQDAHLRLMLPHLPGLAAIKGLLRDLRLEPPAAFKLTVMREQRPDIFRHSLQVTLLSLYLGYQINLESHHLANLAMAALLHDIGILHIDPQLLDSAHSLSDAERHHLYAHPITAWLILRATSSYPTEVLNGVLQHHERLDGSGYPKGLKGQEIGQFGQIIAVAEIVASRFREPTSELEWLKLETIAKLNSRRYGHHLTGFLNIFYREACPPPPCSERDTQQLYDRIFRVSAALSGWNAIAADAEENPALYGHVGGLVQSLTIELLDAGINPFAVEKNILGIEDGAQACFDARVLLDEASWQLRNILYLIRRRWPEIETTDSRATRAIAAWMRDVEDSFSTGHHH